MDRTRDDGGERAFCLFSSGSRPLGVDLSAVVEVTGTDRLVRLPLCPRQVLGLGTYRGRFVPIIGAGGPSEEPGDARFGGGRALLILRGGHGLWGLAIDRAGVSVEDACGFVAGEVPTMPAGLVAVGLVGRDGVSHAILDPGRTWRVLRAEIDQWYRDALGALAPGTPAAMRPS